MTSSPAPIDELVTKLEQRPEMLNEKNVENLKEFFLDIPLELLSKACKKLGGMTFTNKNLLLNDAAFVQRLTDRS